MGDLATTIPFLATAVALAGVTFGFFRYLNATLDEDLRLGVSLWFLGSRPSLNWHRSVLRIFDTCFGERMLSWKRLHRSAAVTVVFGSIYYFFHLTGEHGPIDPSNPFSEDLHSPITWLNFELGLVTFNLAIDYLAIAKSRLFLQFSAKNERSLGTLLVGILGDLATTLVLIIAIAAIFERAVPRQDLIIGNHPIRLYLATMDKSVMLPFVHSLWMVIYLIGTGVTRLAVWVSPKMPGISRFMSKKRIEEEPITLIGEFSAAIVLVIALVVNWVAR